MIKISKAWPMLSAILSICLTCCSEEDSNRPCAGVPLIRDIPKTRFEDTTTYYRFIEQTTKQLGESDAKKGFDSIQIRIWFNLGNDFTCRMLKLSYALGRWRGMLYKYAVIPEKHKIQVTESSKEAVTPVSNWINLMSQLFTDGLVTLNDYRTLPGYNDEFIHNLVYVFEISSCSEYRYFEYKTPSENVEKYEEVRKVMRIMSRLDKEFDLKLNLNMDSKLYNER